MKISLVIILTGIFFPLFLFAQTDYPKLANYYLPVSGRLEPDLMKWDLLILPADLYNKNFFDEFRQKNKDGVILAYIYPAQAHNQTKVYLYQAADGNNWWLFNGQGEKMEIWPHVFAVNVTNGDWRDYNIGYVKNRINLDKWDGIMYDIVDASITHYDKNGVGIDINNDGRADSGDYVNQKWRDGMAELFSQTRDEIGDKIILINGNSLDAYQPDINGRMLETFPTPWEGNGSWEASMVEYLDRLPKKNIEPQIYIINANTKNSGKMDSYREMRFGLASSLLGNGYFSFDHGDQSHSQVWWYDEYDQGLGKARGQAYNLLDKNNPSIKPGLWRRDFEYGLALVNSTDKPQTYVFSKEEFEKINGQQDRRVNDGSKINYIQLAAKDGIVLRKINNEIINNGFNNGSFVRVFNEGGEQVKNGFFAYKDDYAGNVQILNSDIDNDGDMETLVNGSGVISIYDQGVKISQFSPYENRFKGEISLAVSDLNNDGTKEIITGAGRGGGPQVRVFTKDGRPLIGGFFAYGQDFRGGVNVAVMDLNNDGIKEIITGAGPGGGPHVRVFTKDGRPLTGGFFAYDKNFRGGVSVATGNIDGQGDTEIITGAGPGGGPQVKIFSKDGRALNQFFAYEEEMMTGIKVMSDDINNDKIDEILVSTISF